MKPLNNYIDKEMQSFEKVLENNKLSASEKLDTLYDVYFEYVRKMIPLRSCRAFHTERHYILTERLITQLKDKVSILLLQGIKENTFSIENAELAAGFILYGLSSILNTDIAVDESSFTELKQFIDKILKG